MCGPRAIRVAIQRDEAARRAVNSRRRKARSDARARARSDYLRGICLRDFPLRMRAPAAVAGSERVRSREQPNSFRSARNKAQRE